MDMVIGNEEKYSKFESILEIYIMGQGDGIEAPGSTHNIQFHSKHELIFELELKFQFS